MVHIFGKVNQILGRCYMNGGVPYFNILIIQIVRYPSHTFRNVFAQDTHLSLIRAQGEGILVHSCVKDGPTDEVKPLGGIKNLCHTVYKMYQTFGIKVARCRLFLPHFLQHGICIGVGKDACDKIVHVGCRTATSGIHPTVAVADRIDACIVVEGQIEVPARSHHKIVAVAVLRHIGAPVCVRIARKLSHDKMLDERTQVQILAVSFSGIAEVGREDHILQQVEIVCDVLLLLRSDVILPRRLDGDGHAPSGAEP